jgi:peptidoglycan/xylan/chitin deacetylase (PgdA/CDA1 family)
MLPATAYQTTPAADSGAVSIAAGWSRVVWDGYTHTDPQVTQLGVEQASGTAVGTFYIDDITVKETTLTTTFVVRTRTEIQQEIDDNWERLDYTAKPAKFMAITYDDGPTADSSQLLEVLAAKDARVTFFLIGNKINSGEERKATVRDMRDAGHELANHSFSHSPMDAMSAAAIEKEIQDCTSAIHAATAADGKPVLPNFFRAPNVRYSADLLAVCAARGLPLMHGTSASDWGKADTNPNNAANVQGQVNTILGGAAPWQITLNHDPASGIPENILAAAPQIIDGLRAAGYWLLTLSEMAVMYDGTVEAGKIYDNFDTPRIN